MYAATTCLFVLAAVVTSMISTAVALPSAGTPAVPKMKEHTGVGMNIPKQRADPADIKWIKRDGKVTSSPTDGLITKNTHVDTELVTPMDTTKF